MIKRDQITQDSIRIGSRCNEVAARVNPEWIPLDPPRLAPVLMTAAEAAAYLRLTENGRDIADACQSLQNLVRTGRIRPCRVGRHNRYAREELDRFIREQTQRYGPLDEETRR